MNPYTGRFAPSPTGPLHAGSLVAALASWLDARAHGGQWLVRIEDVDTTRCLSGVDRIILGQLDQCGLHSDLPPLYQSERSAAYQRALDKLVQFGLAYPCACTRQQIKAALAQHGTAKPRHGELIYPGTCRSGLRGATARAWRLRTDSHLTGHPGHDAALSCEKRLSLRATTRNPWIPDQVRDDSQGSAPGMTSQRPQTTAAPDLAPQTSPLTSSVSWFDRRLGAQQQDVALDVGDFVLKRADGCFAYQLAVVVDDAAQGITDVVRGEDLADNTARQILLQRALGLPTPRYLHTPLVLGDNGEKLSKQNGAAPLDLAHPLTALNQAAQALGLSPQAGTVPEALAFWTHQWKTLW